MLLLSLAARIIYNMPAMSPEARARTKIDTMLAAAGWIVQSRADLNLHAGPGVAVCEVPTRTGPADYILFLDGRACGALEAKPEGHTLSGVARQGEDYTAAAPQGLPSWADPLPFVYVSTGTETQFQDARDPHPRPRPVFAVPRPEALRRTLHDGSSLRRRLTALPPLDPTGLRACQLEALRGIETSLANGRQRALVQMATGAGKTFAACTLTHRLLTHGGVRRVLFLVDRANLGRQAVGEFSNYRPPNSTNLFTEEYNVQHLQGRVIAPAASVVVSTVQRLYSVLRGVDLDDEDDERSSFDRPADTVERPVSYNADIPPETFDLIIVDECHRSIYGSWRQVLEYFDSFIVGLSATPGNHTRGFFQQNTVSQYPFERSVADGVNVDFEIWRVRTEVGERGGTIPAGYTVPHRDRTSRRQRLAAYDQDLTYLPVQLNQSVEVPNQIRTVLTAYREALPTQLPRPHRSAQDPDLLPERHARRDRHRHCPRGIRGRRPLCAEDHLSRHRPHPQELIQVFRNDHLSRIAVTVDMVATGTTSARWKC